MGECLLGFLFNQERRRMTMPRDLFDIARETKEDWKKPYFAAKPYIDAMQWLVSMNDKYFLDTARDIVLRFLCNAQTWRGETARRIKKELNSMLKGEL